MRAALVQMRSGPEVEANLACVAGLIQQAADEAQLVVLPENFALMPRKDRERITAAERFGTGPIQDFLGAQARQYGLWLVGGTLPILGTEPDKAYAACLVFDPDGRCTARYDKIHLFDVAVSDQESYQESAYIQAGDADNLVTVDTPAGRLGLTVCYDLRFPELYRRLAARGATVYTIPSAFTTVTGQAHWEVLLRARAIESQAYVLAPGQWGTHANGRATFGHSMMVGPWGEVLTCLEEGDGVVAADIDIATVDHLRARFPSLEHRRLT